MTFERVASLAMRLAILGARQAPTYW